MSRYRQASALRTLSEDPPDDARPFLKWAGGKRAVLPHLLPRFRERIGTYHEPFLGGGALFFRLRSERRFEHAILSDMNLRLVRGYRGIQSAVEDVVERLQAFALRHDTDHFYAVRDERIDEATDDAAVAAWLIYLNKTAFNGLYRVNKGGRFNVPIGSYRNPAICDEPNLRACSRALQGVELRNEDFEKVLARATEGDAVYFDPPYVPLSETASFVSYTEGKFGPGDQLRLRDLAIELHARGVGVVLSNHDTPETRALYGEHFPLTCIPVGRSINARADRRGPVQELVIG